MKWPWQPAPIAMSEQVVPCMVCKGDRPKVRVISLWNYVRRNGKIVGVADGERLECQECGAQYSLDFRHGTFQHVQRQPVVQAKEHHVVERAPAPALRNRPGV